MSEALQHFEKPIEILDRIYKMLNKNRIVLIVVEPLKSYLITLKKNCNILD